MRNIWLLVKNNLRSSLGAFRGKSAKRQNTFGMGFILVIYLAIIAAITYFQIQSVQEYAVIGAEAVVLALGIIMGCVLAFAFAIQRVSGGQAANDNELLLAMPIKRSEIIIAKALSRYLFNLLVVTIAILPSMIAYWLYVPFVPLAFCGVLLVYLLIPLLSVCVSYFIDFMMAYLFPASRYGNLIKAVLTIALLIAFVIGYEYLLIQVEFLLTFVQLVLDFNPILMLSMLGITAILFAIGVWMSTVLLTRENHTHRAKSLKLTGKKITPFGALLRNETRRYFDSTTLMVNTLLSPLAVVALIVWQIFDQGGTFIILCQAMGLPNEFFYVILTLFETSLVVLTYASACSISLEAKQLWILRSMPIAANAILTAKAVFYILILSPVIVIGNLLLGIIIAIEPLYLVLMCLIPVAFNVIMAFGGIMINLLFPKFEFESEAAVIKHSMSANVTVLTGMMIMVVFGLLFYALMQLAIDLVWNLMIIFGVALLLSIVIVVLTLTVGKRIFNRL